MRGFGNSLDLMSMDISFVRGASLSDRASMGQLRSAISGDRPERTVIERHRLTDELVGVRDREDPGGGN